jgi:glycosyltransferase involved in cell wall biosynthesis
MSKISLMIHTASCDNFLTNQGINSYFKALTNCLKKQKHKDFELIFVDTFYEENKENFSSMINSLEFQVKHVEIHANHRYWFDQGYCYISAAKNTGILYADGELLVTCDDAEFFPEDFLERYWNHYKNSSCYMLACHKRMKSMVLDGDTPAMPITGDIYVNDHRLLKAKEQLTCHKYGSWAYAGSSFSLEDAITLNGFNEKMDGCKSLEDCDFGGRLVMLGRGFITDTEGFLYILDHQSYGDVLSTHWNGIIPDDYESKTIMLNNKKKIENFIAIENYGMLKCAEELYELKANKTKVSDQHLKIIQRETIKYRNFDPLSPDNKDKLEIWLNTPNFNLEQEREQLRNSGSWQWKN